METTTAPTTESQITVRRPKHRRGYEKGYTPRLWNWIHLRRDLTGTEKHMLCVLLSYSYGKATFIMTDAQLADLMSRHPNNVAPVRNRLRTRLHDDGAPLVTIKVGKSKGSASVYTLHRALLTRPSAKPVDRPVDQAVNKTAQPPSPKPTESVSYIAPQPTKSVGYVTPKANQISGPLIEEAGRKSSPKKGRPSLREAFFTSSSKTREEPLGIRIRRMRGWSDKDLNGGSDLPFPDIMWAEVQRLPTSRLSPTEREWIKGQQAYREKGRSEWSAKEKTFLSNIYVQKVMTT